VDLRALDARVVPGWARRAQTARASLAAAPDPVTALRGLDERYATGGVLRVVRDAPVLGVLVAATVLVAGAGTGLALAWDTAAVVDRAPQAVVLGAPAGADAEGHLAAAADRAVELARSTPAAEHLALLSVRDELTIDQTARLVVESGLQIRTTWVRAPVPGSPETFRVEPGADAQRTLTALYTATADRKAAEQQELLALAAGTAPGAPARASYEAAAATAAAEAQAYRTGCACVVAVLVEGPAVELAELLSLPSVRGVEVAPRGSRAQELEVSPLLPDVTGAVPSSPGGAG
jgi:hypothetical protein